MFKSKRWATRTPPKTCVFNKLFKIQEEHNNNNLTNQHINEICLESKQKIIKFKMG
jgi:hypothetical protein